MFCHHHRVWKIFKNKKHAQLIKYIYFFSKSLKTVIGFWKFPAVRETQLLPPLSLFMFTIFFKLKKRCDFLLPSQFHSRISMAHWQSFMVEGHSPQTKSSICPLGHPQSSSPKDCSEERNWKKGVPGPTFSNRETHFYRLCSFSLRYEIPLELRVLRSSSFWKQLSKGTHVGL